MSNTNLDDFLAHYGVKGMKWGVRKAREGSSVGSSGRDKKASVGQAASALNAFAVNAGADSAVLESKYGPSSIKKDQPPADDRSFYQKHKTAINVGVGVAAAGLVAYGGYQYHQNVVGKRNVEVLMAAQKAMDLDNARNRERLAKQRDPAQEAELSFLRETYGARTSLLSNYVENSDRRHFAGFDPSNLSNDPINITKGTIFKRISSEKETELKASGFFASYQDEDVDRYKAILPTFWPKWGIPKDSGYVVNIKANADVKAPSPKKAYDIYREMLSEPEFRKLVDANGAGKGMSDDDYAKQTFPALALAWNTPTTAPVKMYMDRVKSSGYNALLDQNDAGLLSKNPMLLLDTKSFSIQGHDSLSAKEIGETQIREAKKLGLV